MCNSRITFPNGVAVHSPNTKVLTQYGFPTAKCGIRTFETYKGKRYEKTVPQHIRWGRVTCKKCLKLRPS